MYRKGTVLIWQKVMQLHCSVRWRTSKQESREPLKLVLPACCVLSSLWPPTYPRPFAKGVCRWISVLLAVWNPRMWSSTQNCRIVGVRLCPGHKRPLKGPVQSIRLPSWIHMKGCVCSMTTKLGGTRRCCRWNLWVSGISQESPDSNVPY